MARQIHANQYGCIEQALQQQVLQKNLRTDEYHYREIVLEPMQQLLPTRIKSQRKNHKTRIKSTKGVSLN